MSCQKKFSSGTYLRVKDEKYNRELKAKIVKVDSSDKDSLCWFL